MLSRTSNQEKTIYQYDLQGNVLKATGTEGVTTYGYNAFNQQTTVSMADGSILENHYDAEYLRAGTVENGKARSFLYYNGELLAESKTNTPTKIKHKKENEAENKAELGTEDNVISRYILGYGVAVGWNQKRKGYHSYHLDEQNSTAYVTDEAGSVQNSYQYGAFGDIRNKQESFHNRILYTGQQYDQVSGQYYLRARFYNPVVGRFLQEDVYRGDGLNLYAYCANNPVKYYDPSGYAEDCTNNNGTTNVEKNTRDKEDSKKTEIKAGDKTPGGKEFTEHGAEQENKRRYTPEDVNNIVNNWTEKLYQLGGKTAYIKKQSYGYDVVIIDQNGRSIISVIGGNVRNGVKNTLNNM